MFHVPGKQTDDIRVEILVDMCVRGSLPVFFCLCIPVSACLCQERAQFSCLCACDISEMS